MFRSGLGQVRVLVFPFWVVPSGAGFDLSGSVLSGFSHPGQVSFCLGLGFVFEVICLAS